MHIAHAITKARALLVPRISPPSTMGKEAGGLGRANPVAGLLYDHGAERLGLGDDWAPSTYGDYLAVSPTVYACVHFRARNLARVRLRLHARGPDGSLAPVADEHPAQRLLDRPNPFWSRQRFWYMVEASLDLWGSAPVALARDGRGRVRELWWLHPSRFHVVPGRAEYVAGYLYAKDGLEIAFAPQDVLWFRYPNPLQEHAALSPVAALRMSIDMGVDAIRFNRRFFQNDATPGRVYLKTEVDLTTAQAEELRLRWERAFKDPSRAHRIAVLDKSADLKSLAVTQRDMEFVEAQRFTKEEVCAAYGVPPVLLGDLRFSSLNNYQLAKASFWDETLVPQMQSLEAEVEQTLLPQLGDSLVARFDLSEVSALREDQNAKAERYERLVKAGILTINEVRAREGLPPVPWGDGPGR